MELTIASNWDPELVTQLEEFTPVREFFGVMQKTPVGSGRPYFIVADPNKEEVAAYIEQVHDSGRTFNYLLNGACMNNMEYDIQTHQEILAHIRWLREIGVDSVTVTVPYLVDIIKTQFPDLPVRISVIAHVNSVQRARLFEKLGADSITLDFNINRDFKLLEKIRKAVSCKLILIANEPCLYQCPYRLYHYNLLAHSTQPYNPLDGFYIDYCILRCTMERYLNPAEIMKSRWIRPEDLPLYQATGIDFIKLSGRRMSTRWLQNVARAYSEQSYEGNLLELLNCVSPGVDPDVRSPQYRNFLKQSELMEREKLIKIGQLHPIKPYIENKKLDGFVKHFKEKNCLNDCGECCYCEAQAREYVRLDPAEAGRYIDALKGLLGDLSTGRLFTTPSPQTHTAAQDIWQPAVWETFEKVIGQTPDMFRDIARKTVASRARANADERQSECIEEIDMVRAFLSETPESFKGQMIDDLESRGIRISDYQ